MLGLVPRESERRGAQARYTRKPPREVRDRAGTWEHGLAPKERRLLARAVPFHGACTECRQRGAARRASEAHVVGLVPRASERRDAQARYTCRPRRAVRGRAGTWKHGLAPKERRLLARAVPFHGACSECRQGSAARARRKRTCWASSPERASAETRKALHAQATREEAGLARGSTGWRRRNGGFSLVQCPFMVRAVSVASAARRARASEAHVLGLVPRESERRDTQARYTRKPPRAVRGKAGTWKHGLAPKERRLLARAVPFHGACSECRQRGAARARVGSARAGPRPQSASAGDAQARYTRRPPRAVRGRAGTWKHGLAPKERRLLARAVPFHGACSECRQRSAARARRKRTCWASSPERASAETRKRATRASHLAQ